MSVLSNRNYIIYFPETQIQERATEETYVTMASIPELPDFNMVNKDN